MAKRTKKKVLLIEPNYANKFPPVGLMKIATYYRNLGNWEVVFYKGDMKHFVIEQITDKLIDKLNDADGVNHDWYYYKDILFDYIRTRQVELLEQLPLTIQSEDGERTFKNIVLTDLINEAKDRYWKKIWEQEPEWDRVAVTTLFTFYWDITVETIEWAKKLVKDTKSLMVGGVLASIQPQELSKATGLHIHKHGESGGIHVGILRPGDLDRGDKQKIDELELDYSILDEIEYKYPMSNAYYRYSTRGCVNKCAFCAVPTLEPDYIEYIPLLQSIKRVNDLYGPQKDLLLMDNNVLASKEYPKIIQEIKDCGFYKGAKFYQPNLLEITIRNLTNKINDHAYIRKVWRIIDEFYDSIKDKNESYKIYTIREKYHITKFLTSTKENLIAAYNEIKPIYEKYHKPGLGKLRIVDFNQGLDARLFTPEKAQLLGQIAISPVRIAFDDVRTEKKYCEAIRMCTEAGMKNFSNYLLYNFKDKPEDLYYRLKINVDLCDELHISIYSFPMKFHPICRTDEMNEDYSHNRDYIGIYWNRKYIRAVQAILNSTKGKIGRGTEFFQKAFGKTTEEYKMLLEMPEIMIIYRFFFEWLGKEGGIIRAKEVLGHSMENMSTSAWWECFNKCRESVSSEEWNEILNYIHKNDFNSDYNKLDKPIVKRLLSYYEENRKSIVLENTELYTMKQEYDKNPTLKPIRHARK